MPYIKKDDRKRFDHEINILTGKLLMDENGVKESTSPGELNYIVSSIVWKLFDCHPSYTNGNALVGALECVKQEFIRRRLNDYEDEKITENGDL